MEIDEHEVGYLALHVHAAIEDQKVSQAMQMTRVVRDCISLVEEQTGTKIDVMSLSYNRLMNHIRYMVARALNGEKLKVNMNDYISIRFPKAFEMAVQVCGAMEKNLKIHLDDVETGYLAMHMERVMGTELK
ncbi:PRD domain-containing protein [Blautia sp.]|uniref:GlcA/glcB genes antiterminator n=1 Tax=Blautia glucerasea TaxID=536633 RepID=A0A6N2TBF6_9FIRM